MAPGVLQSSLAGAGGFLLAPQPLATLGAQLPAAFPWCGWPWMAHLHPGWLLQSCQLSPALLPVLLPVGPETIYSRQGRVCRKGFVCPPRSPGPGEGEQPLSQVVCSAPSNSCVTALGFTPGWQPGSCLASTPRAQLVMVRTPGRAAGAAQEVPRACRKGASPSRVPAHRTEHLLQPLPGCLSFSLTKTGALPAPRLIPWCLLPMAAPWGPLEHLEVSPSPGLTFHFSFHPSSSDPSSFLL